MAETDPESRRPLVVQIRLFLVNLVDRLFGFFLRQG
jgi:hypothetical protein